MAASKTVLNWVTVNAGDIPCAKEYAALGAAREAFKQAMIARARKAGKLAADETLVIAHKAWGISMAKTHAKGVASAKAGDAFGDL